MVVVFFFLIFFYPRERVKVNSSAKTTELKILMHVCVSVCVRLYVSHYNVFVTKVPSFWNCITLVDRCVGCGGGSGNIALQV